MYRELININADDNHHEDLQAYQDKYLKGNDHYKESPSSPIGSAVVVHCEDGGSWTYGVVE